MSVTIWLVIGGLAGWTTAKLMASPEGVVVNVVIGMLGAFVGGWAASASVASRFRCSARCCCWQSSTCCDAAGRVESM